jgi:hypothetical protein
VTALVRRAHLKGEMRSVVTTVLFVTLICLVAAWWVLLDGLCSGPTQPDPAAGYTVPLSCRGERYITEVQYRGLVWLPIAFWALLLVGIWRRRRDES